MTSFKDKNNYVFSKSVAKRLDNILDASFPTLECLDWVVAIVTKTTPTIL